MLFQGQRIVESYLPNRSAQVVQQITTKEHHDFALSEVYVLEVQE